MSEGSKVPSSDAAGKPMPAIQIFHVLATDNPNLLGLGFDTPIGSVLLAANKQMVLEMLAKLSVAVEQMREPS
jgi:hypothetical protein